MKKFAKSCFAILLLLISIFTISCENILINNEASISFNLGENTASYIKNSCKSIKGFSKDSEIKVLCSLLKGEKLALQQSKNVTLKNIGQSSFDIRNIPYCNNYKVKISFSYNDILIFFASSDTIVLNDSNKNPLIKLTITPAPQKITYNLNGGSFVEAYPINYFITSSLRLPTPIKENAIFSHWELDDGTNVTVLGKDNFLGEVTLNAKWTEQNITPDTPLYKVTFDANGHGTAPQSIDLPEGADIPINKLAPLTADGYIFGGWFKDNTTFKQKWTPSTDKVQKSPITLYAKWDIKSYKITYETGITQTVEQKTINHGSKLESNHLPNNLTKDQFAFDNWKYKGGSKNGTVAQIGDTVTEDITLEAVWTPFGTTADVVISGPDGNNVEKKGTNITLTCSTPGAQIYYTTDGSTPTTSLSPVSSPATITLNNAATIKAFATKSGNTQSSITTKEFVLKKYNVTFETSYGSVSPVQLTEGSKISEPSTLTQAGYTLQGWIKEKGTTPDSDVLWNFSSDTMPGNDITLTAKWEINKYTITYTGTPESITEKTVDYGTKLADIHLPANITKPENDFKEWKYKGGTNNGTVAQVGDTVTEDITLEAVWTQWTKLDDVTFSKPTGSVDAGDTITLSSVKGSTIYYTTDKSDPKTSETRTTKAPNDLGNTETTITINTDTQIKAYATAPKKLDSNIVTNDYTILKYTVTFDAKGHGTAPDPIALPRGSDIPSEKLEPLTADGYKFIGWFKDNNTFNNEWTPSTDKVQASPITLYAKWEQKLPPIVTWSQDTTYFTTVMKIENDPSQETPVELNLGIVYDFCFDNDGYIHVIDDNGYTTTNPTYKSKFPSAEYTGYHFIDCDTKTNSIYLMKEVYSGESGDVYDHHEIVQLKSDGTKLSNQNIEIFNWTLDEDPASSLYMNFAINNNTLYAVYSSNVDQDILLNTFTINETNLSLSNKKTVKLNTSYPNMLINDVVVIDKNSSGKIFVLASADGNNYGNLNGGFDTTVISKGTILSTNLEGTDLSKLGMPAGNTPTAADSKTELFGPLKFISVNNTDLLIADDGVLNDKTNVNRIVTYSTTSNTITSVNTASGVTFNEEYTAP